MTVNSSLLDTKAQMPDDRANLHLCQGYASHSPSELTVAGQFHWRQKEVIEIMALQQPRDSPSPGQSPNEEMLLLESTARLEQARHLP